MKPSNIGGQAVMEGIMMRHKDKYAVAVRRPDKEIEIKVEDYKCTFGKAGFLKWPIIRGVVSFVDGLVVGTKCLMYSAEIAGDEEDEKEAAKNAALSEEELSAKKAKEAKQFQWLLYITVAISIIFSVAAFMLLPYALASLLRKVGVSEFGVTVAEAFVKLALFLGYMFLISRMKDIQRTFMYHGAEHKCINCVEHGLPLTVENVMASSRQHKRCGTSFLFLVMLVSICLHFVFVLVPGYWVRLFGRLLMVPVVSGISFEIIQWAGRTDTKFADMMSKPGLAMQKLTTKEPTADMVEVAIKAVEAVFDWKEYQSRLQAVKKSTKRKKVAEEMRKSGMTAPLPIVDPANAKKKSGTELASEIKKREQEYKKRADERKKYMEEMQKREDEIAKVMDEVSKRKEERQALAQAQEEMTEDELSSLDRFFDDPDGTKSDMESKPSVDEVENG